MVLGLIGLGGTQASRESFLIFPDDAAIDMALLARWIDEGHRCSIIWHSSCLLIRGMIVWTMKCLKAVGFVALATVVLALAFAVGTGITALSQWDEFEHRVE